MIADIYTTEEIVASYKKLNEELNAAISRSELDTSQSRHEWQKNISEIRNQRDYWGKMYEIKNGSNGGIVQIVGK